MAEERLTVDDVIDAFREHFHIESNHERAIELALATVISVKVRAEAIWLAFTGVPSSFKTEIIRSFKESEFVEFASDITVNTFASGWQPGRAGSDDFLPKLDGKCLAIKDLTPILDKPTPVMKEIISQLRDIYDGFFVKRTGGPRREIAYEVNFSMLTGVTEKTLERRLYFNAELGERMLRFHLRTEDQDAASDRVMANKGRMKEIRLEVARVVDKFLKQVWLAGKRVRQPQNPFSEHLKKLAKFVAYGRTPVRRNPYKRFIETAPVPEEKMRLVGQLDNLLMCVAINRSHDEITLRDFNLVKKVALDTIPVNRSKALEFLKVNGIGTLLEMKQVFNLSDLPTKETMEDLVRIGLVREETLHEEGKRGRPPKIWLLTDEAEEVLRMEAHGPDVEPIFEIVDIPSDPGERAVATKAMRSLEQMSQEEFDRYVEWHEDRIGGAVQSWGELGDELISSFTDYPEPPWMKQERMAEEMAEKLEEDRITQPSWEPDPDAEEKLRQNQIPEEPGPSIPEMERNEQGHLVPKKRGKERGEE